MESPGRRELWRIAVSLGYPHPDLLADDLTPGQLFELCLYHVIEPFGEVREDLRMASIKQFYYDSKRGKKGKRVPLGDFALYPHLYEKTDGASEADLLRALGE